MKVRETLVIMSLFTALSHSMKLLKVPRIYNALITSEENLLPSQAYPALAPVVHGIQYPIPGYISGNVYRTIVVPNQVQYSDTRSYTYSVHNSVKEDYYHYNIVESGRPFKFDIPKIPSDEERNLEHPAFFRSVPLKQGRNVHPVTDSTSAPFVDNHAVYFESSPAQQDDNQQDPRSQISNTKDYGVPFQNPNYNTYNEVKNLAETDSNVDTSTPSEENNRSNLSDVEEEKTDTRFDNLPETLEDLVKNNRPKDTDIVDVPPPPVPVGRKSDKKSDTKNKKEEYPPPAVGFI